MINQYKFKEQKSDKNIILANNSMIRMLAKELLEILKESNLGNESRVLLVSSVNKIILSNRVLGKGHITGGMAITREALENCLYAIYLDFFEVNKINVELDFVKGKILENEHNIFGVNVFEKLPMISEKANSLQEVYNYLSNIVHPTSLKQFLLKVEDSNFSTVIGAFYRNNNIFILTIIFGYIINKNLLEQKNNEIIKFNNIYSILSITILTYLQFLMYISKSSQLTKIIIDMNKQKGLIKYLNRIEKGKEIAITYIKQTIEETIITDDDKNLLSHLFEKYSKKNKDILYEELEYLYEEGFLHKKAYLDLKKHIHQTKGVY